jgi:hypothetical protein
MAAVVKGAGGLGFGPEAVLEAGQGGGSGQVTISFSAE